MVNRFRRREFLACAFGSVFCACHSAADRLNPQSQGGTCALSLDDFLFAVETTLRQMDAAWHPADARGKAACFQRAMVKLPALYPAHLQQAAGDRCRDPGFTPHTVHEYQTL